MTSCLHKIAVMRLRLSKLNQYLNSQSQYIVNISMTTSAEKFLINVTNLIWLRYILHARIQNFFLLREGWWCLPRWGGGGGRSEAFFFLLFVFDKFISTPPHPAPSCLDPCMFQHILDWACEKKNISIFLQLSSTRFYKEFLLCQKRDIMLGFLLQLICHDVKILNNFFLGLLLWCYSFIIISYILSRCRKP